MSLVNFESSGPEPKGQKKSLKIVLGIGALVGVIALGSTLAASISLNAGAPVEFGQGVTQTTACDDQVKLTPISSFSNDEESGFKFTAITLSDLDGTSQTDPNDKGCAGKSFTIKSYDLNGTLLTPTYSISLAADGSFSSSDGNTDGNETEGDFDSSVKLTFDSPSIDAESVYRITIESGGSAQTIYSDSLTNGKPAWISEVNADYALNFLFGFSSDGMYTSGNAGDFPPFSYTYPYVSAFEIPGTEKVIVQFTFNYNESCADHGVILYKSEVTPLFIWGQNSTGLSGQWDCGFPMLSSSDQSVGGSEPGGVNQLTYLRQYIGILSYDPTLSANNLTLITKALDGTVLSSLSITSSLSAGNYKIGFSADNDETPNNIRSYFTDLTITIG